MLSDGARAKRLLSSTTLAGIITTIAGNGFTDKYGDKYGGYSGDNVHATAAQLNYPHGIRLTKVVCKIKMLRMREFVQSSSIRL